MAELNRPWLNRYDPQVTANVDYDIKPLHEFLDATAAKWPKRTAILFQNNRISYEKLQHMTEIFAANLKKAGLNKGDKVAVMLPNTPQAVIAYWGILRAGGVVVMTNPLYMETEIIHQFNDSGARFCICLDLLWPKLNKLRGDLPIEKFFVTGIAESLAFPLNFLYRVKEWRAKNIPEVGYNNKNICKFKTLLKGKDTYTCDIVDPEEDLALLQYTGGTTGIAKGCMITHRNLACNMQQCHAMIHTLGQEAETFIGILPFFHIYGLTVCVNFATLVGATIMPFPRYSPKDVLKAIHKIQPTVFPGAPAVYISLLQQKNVQKYNLSSIRYCIAGSSPMPVEYIEKYRRITGAKIVEGFGLTEASPVTHITPLNGVQKPGSIGFPFPDTDAKIVDMDVGGDQLAPHKRGELCIRGPQVMKGYYNRADETADVLRNGWLYTGDIGYMDEEGYFYIVDRKKDLIISSGYNIYPREVDEVLFEHPAIKEAVTVGIPHKSRGEIIKVYIVLEPNQELSKSDVISYCREKLANYKIPRQVEFREDLPKTMVGKVLRRALREEEMNKKANKKK
ncbi:MAG: long-chain-fatty-acid--CoA ligase [Desulfovibrio sp.]